MMKDDDRAVSLLRQFLRINTTNPPGNEEEGILFLEAVLKGAGISSAIYRSAPKRANLLARIKGKRDGKPIILLSHVDVVAAREDEWDTDPFGGEIRDGFIYGRGAIDMKSQTICQLLAFKALREKGTVPERDILFLATGDEEVGGKFGAEYMVREVSELRDASFVLSEGGCITPGAKCDCAAASHEGDHRQERSCHRDPATMTMLARSSSGQRTCCSTRSMRARRSASAS